MGILILTCDGNTWRRLQGLWVCRGPGPMIGANAERIIRGGEGKMMRGDFRNLFACCPRKGVGRKTEHNVPSCGFIFFAVSLLFPLILSPAARPTQDGPNFQPFGSWIEPPVNFQLVALQQTGLQTALQSRRAGDALEREGRLAEALAEYQKVVDVLRKIPPDPQNRELSALLDLTTRTKIARTQRRLGLFIQAENTYKSLIPEARQTVEKFRNRIPFQLTAIERDLTRTYCDALVDAADFYRNLNQPAQARSYWKLLSEISSKAMPDRGWEQVSPLLWPPRVAARYLDGELSRLEMDVDRALQAFQEAKDLVKRIIPVLKRQQNTEMLVAELESLEALTTHGLALCFYDKGQDNPDKAGENYKLARTHYLDALTLLEGDHTRLAMGQRATCHSNLGICYHEWAKLFSPPDPNLLSLAEKELREAEKLCLQMNAPVPQQLAHIYNSLGLLLLETQRPAEADRCARRALEQLQLLSGISANYELRRNALLVRARAAWELAGDDLTRRKEAIGLAKEALQCVHQQLFQIIGDPYRRGRARQKLWGRIEGTLASWYKALLTSGEHVQLSEVLSLFERSRAQSLLEEIALAQAARRGNPQSGDLDPALEELHTLQRRMAELNFRLQIAKGGDLASLREELRSTEAKYHDVLHRMWMETSGSRFAGELLSDLTPERLEGILQWIENKRLLVLYYLVDRDRSFLLVIPPIDPRTNWKLIELEITEDQADMISEALGERAAHNQPSTNSSTRRPVKVPAGPVALRTLRAIVDPSHGLLAILADKEANEPFWALRALGEILLPEVAHKWVADTTGYEVLLIAADGPLAQFPFQTLVVPYGVVDEYLVEVSNPIVYAPSLTVAHRLDTSAQQDVRVALSLGKVDFSEYQSVFRNRPATLYDVPYECSQVSRILEGKGLKVSQLVDKSPAERELTKAALRRLVPGAHLIHLATHGYGGQEFKEWSGCLLLSVPPGQDQYAGILTLPEIYRLPLESTELVLLSSCLTYSGVELEGEGIWAVARGFLAAGARQVVATLWSVDSRAACEIMIRVAREVGISPQTTTNDGTKPTALGTPKVLIEAQRHLRRVPDRREWRKPYFWAPFVLIGAPR